MPSLLTDLTLARQKTPHLPESIKQAWLGPLGCGKTKALLETYLTLLQNHRSDEVWVLVASSAQQHQLQKAALAGLSQLQQQNPQNSYLKGLGGLNIYTYPGLVRNMLFHFWPLLEEKLLAQWPNAAHLSRLVPQLVGLDETEFLFQTLLKTVSQQNPEALQALVEQHLLTSRGLLNQLLRRQRLKSEHRLSRETFNQRSQILELPAQPLIEGIEAKADRQGLCLRMLDASRQLDGWHHLLESSEPVKTWLSSNIKHLLVDDWDESTPAQQAFTQILVEQGLAGLYLTMDEAGGARRGYLNAYPEGAKKLLNQWISQKEQVKLKVNKKNPVLVNANLLLNRWLNPPEALNTKPEDYLPQALSLQPLCRSWVEQVDNVFIKLEKHLQAGGKPSDLLWVLPQSNLLTLQPFITRLERLGVPFQLLNGTQRPANTPYCRALLSAAQWLRAKEWGIQLSVIEFQQLFSTIFIAITSHFNLLAIESLAKACYQAQLKPLAVGQGLLPSWDWLNPGEEAQSLEPAYQALISWAEENAHLDLERWLLAFYQAWLKPSWSESTSGQALELLLRSLERQRLMAQGLNNEKAFNPNVFECQWVQQAKAGTVADTPETPAALNPDALIIATPQKVLDYEVRRKEQWWLDIRSRDWARTDEALLYDAYVQSAAYQGEVLEEIQHAQELKRRERAGFLTRKLMLLAGEKVYLFASELDWEGQVQEGPLADCFSSEILVKEAAAKAPRAILRPDQQPVLDYKSGTMAITAVPGAGKTFVTVELLLELLKRGVLPENILVLTYMEAAAKTLQERLKQAIGTNEPKALPVIGTIHSLAYRLLTEKDHAQRVGLPATQAVNGQTGWSMADEIQAEQTLQQVASQIPPPSIGTQHWRGETWLRCLRRGIDYAKAHRLTPSLLADCHHFQALSRIKPGLTSFFEAYKLYQQLLAAQGLLDFTDLILKAVTLLEENAEVRASYQNHFLYIVEDEAQDSSRLLQRLLNLLGGENPNLIRVGDTNQSITTTFSAAEPTVFREFIAEADLVVTMNQSGRCAKEISELANFWLTQSAIAEPAMKKAFLPVEMLPVGDANPKLLEPLEANLFDFPEQEQRWLVEKVKTLKSAYPQASIAVLVRYNRDATDFAGLLQQHGLPAISHSDSLAQMPVFDLLLAYLQLLASPNQASARQTLWQAFINVNWLGSAGLSSQNQQAVHSFLESTPLFGLPLEALPSTAPAYSMLVQWYYDVLEFSLEASGFELAPLLVKLTDRVFSSVVDRSNGYLCALQAQTALQQWRQNTAGANAHLSLSPLEVVIRHLEKIKRSRKSIKTLSPEHLGITESLISSDIEGFSQSNLAKSPPEETLSLVHVMSLHKAKGQEFDFVLIPQLTQRQIPSCPDKVRLDPSDEVVLAIDGYLNSLNTTKNSLPSSKNPLAKDKEALKLDTIEEEARLMYVGITRARRGLWLSASQKAKTFNGKLYPVEPTLAFQLAQAFLNTHNPEIQ